VPEDVASLQQKIRWRPSTLFWDFTRLILVVCYRRFGTNNLCHFQGSFFFDCLKTGPVHCAETSATNNPSALRKIPEGRVSHSYWGGGKLKPRVISTWNIHLFATKQRQSAESTLICISIANVYRTWFRTEHSVGHTAAYSHRRPDRRQTLSQK